MKKSLYILLIMAILPTMMLAQGSLVLIGGGSEDYESWSDAPYKWAVDQSQNKRVAVLSYSSSTDWIRDYFISLGAADAKTFIINSVALADAQSTYDSLVGYDVIFIKGGDQSDYYLTYKNTKTQAALQYVYNNGGVLCGTSAGCAILSPIVYTAENGSLYSDDVLLSPNSPAITLKNDFLTTSLSNWIFDTHFVERGRLPRLSGFIYKWQADNGIYPKGMGVDARTAICISPDGIGTVMGSGSVTILGNETSNDNTYKLSNEGVLRINQGYRQLVHGCTYDFNTGEITGIDIEFLPDWYTPGVVESDFMILSEDATLNADNQSVLQQLDIASDESIVIVTGATNSLATAYQSYLQSLNYTNVSIVNVTSSEAQPSLASTIQGASVNIFVNNDMKILSDFFSNEDQIVYPARRQLFFGQDVDLAGRSWSPNYLTDAYTCSDGTLESYPGIKIVDGIVMRGANNYDLYDYWENMQGGLPYMLLKNEAYSGIILPTGGIMKIDLTAPNDEAYGYATSLKAGLPIQMMTALPHSKFTDQIPLGNTLPRNSAAGFLGLITITPQDSLTLFINVINQNKDVQYKKLAISPNPSNGLVTINGIDNIEQVMIYDMSGILVKSIQNPSKTIDINQLPKGMYILKVQTKQHFYVDKVLKL